MNSSMALSKTRVSNAQGSPRGTQMPSPRATIKLPQMPHPRDCQLEQMPRGCPGGGGGDGHCWNWLMHYEGLAGLSTSPATIKTTRLVVKLSLEIQDITCPCIDTNFIFERSTQYLTSEHSKRVRYRVEHEKIKFVSTSRNVIFCLLQKHTNDNIFNDFPKISNHISEHYPMIAEDDRRRSEDVSIIHQQI